MDGGRKNGRKALRCYSVQQLLFLRVFAHHGKYEARDIACRDIK